MWPSVNSYARDLIKNTIEPILKEAMLPYKMGDFQFERIVLGNIVSYSKPLDIAVVQTIFFQPPRIGGIKVYDQNVSRSEVIMDIDLL